MSQRKNLLLATLLFALFVTANAQVIEPAKPMSVAEMAVYQGPDRQTKLLEGAKKESGLSVYHTYPALTNLMNEFGKKYGIKVKSWRAGSEAVLQRVTSESRGNKFDVDIVQNNAPENEAAFREKLLLEVKSPYQNDLLPQAVPTHKQWVGITLDIWTAAYNTDKIKKEDLPKSYKDLLDPKWKGQLGIEGNNHAWFGALMGKMGEEEGQSLNNSYRKKDYATNVLTFDYAQEPVVMADLVLCAPVVAREAKEQGKTLAAHYAHLLVHGTLHAQGWDHETSEADAQEMEAYEVAILAGLGFKSPY